MIEVEVRGPLSESQAEALQATLAEQGKHVRLQDREMILLRGFLGYEYDADPTTRSLDVRLRKTLLRSTGATDGQAKTTCEIMVKRTAAAGNVGRFEQSLPLATDDLESAKRVMAALGCKQGLWMHRVAEIYELNGIEWTIAAGIHRSGNPTIRYFEAELPATTTDEIPALRDQLVAAAQALNLELFDTDEKMRAFIRDLDEAVNDTIELTI